jgi:hypothetical protein
MENGYFEKTDIKTGNFEFISLLEAMKLKYVGMLKDRVKEINFVHKDKNAYVEVVYESVKLDLEIIIELVRELFNLNFTGVDGDILFNSNNSIDYNANLFLNLDDYTTILVADTAFTQEAIEIIIEVNSNKQNSIKKE